MEGKMTKKRVLGVIGLGHVGAHVAYSLAVQGIADELILVDQNAQKVASEVQDLRDSVAYFAHRVNVRAGDFAGSFWGWGWGPDRDGPAQRQ